VEAAVVLAREQPTGDQQLIAYVIGRPGRDVSGASLRLPLRSVLPGYMIPTAIVPLDGFPLTPDGKIDRRALEKLASPAGPSGTMAAPATEAEEVMAAVWAEAFNVPSVSRDDNFFALGGDSLVATFVAAKLHAALGVQIDLRAFADHPRLSSLASIVEALQVSGSASGAPMARASRDEPLPLSSFQERIWKFSQSPETSADYTVARRIRIKGPIDVDVLRVCLNFLGGLH
jgi:acyl carrier protein